MSIKFNEVTWYSKLGAIILFILVVPVLTFCIGRKYQEVIDIQVVSVTNTSSPKHMAASPDHQGAVSPLSSTYHIDDQDVTLSNGSFEQSVEGSSGTFETKLFGEPVYGDLNGDGVNDAISFLYQETPGTGIFFYAVATINVNGSYVGTNAIFLGDRIAPQNITISKGVAAANYATRKDSDPMTTDPSVGVTKYVKIEGLKLVEGR